MIYTLSVKCIISDYIPDGKMCAINLNRIVRVCGRETDFWHQADDPSPGRYPGYAQALPWSLDFNFQSVFLRSVHGLCILALQVYYELINLKSY